MQLKRLELHGFKSFADRTVLDFTPGITAVVGPNGSGKSNVSDAILWALGEQNIRHLRGEGAQDVIFAGAAGRRPLGLAEVSLCLDNGDRALPLDFAEVTITRRAYRSGEAEFFINRAPCRLRDIYELFLDTGVGRDAYSIIGQNHIEQVLSARGEERRELLEEAAGIKKYRHRRREATRKLDHTRQNLLRVADILSELQAQVGPVGRQAEVARQFQALDDRRRDLERGLLAIDLARARGQLAELEHERESAGDEITACEAQRRSLEAEELRLRLALQEQDASAHAARSEAEQHKEAALRAESEITLHRQRSEAQASARSRAEEEIARSDAAARDAGRDADTAEATMAAAQSAHRQAEGRTIELAGILGASESAARVAQQARDDARRQVGALAARLAALEGQAHALERRLDDEQNHAQQNTGRPARLQAGVDEARAQAAVAADQLRLATQALDTRERALADAKAALSAAESARQDRSRQLQKAQTEAMQHRARLKSLEELHDSLEGIYRGVRAVLQASRKRALDGHYQLVADLLTVPDEYRTAIEVALGGHAQDIVTDTDTEAQAAITYLKRQGLGRATFLPLDLVRGDRMRADRRPGVIGVASDLIEFPSEVARAIDTLLGRIVVVEDLPSAVRLARGGLGARLVTLDGEVVNPNGSLTGGSREGGPGILSRKLEIDRLRRDGQALSTDLEARESAAASAAAGAEAAARRQEEERSEAARLRLELSRAESADAAARKDLALLERELERAAGEEADARGRLERERQALAELQLQGSALQGERNELDDRAARLECAAADQEQALAKARQEASEAQSERARTREAMRAAEDALQRARRTLQAQDATLQRRRTELAALASTAPVDVEALLDRAGSAREAAAEASRLIERLAGERGALMQDLGAASLQLRQAADQRTALLERAHRVEVRQAGLTSDVGHITLRLQEEYGLSPEDAAPLAALVPSRQNAAVEINRLKREIAALGPVNVGAVVEYSRLTEREEFLSTQRRDLEDAEQTLLRVIEEIDEKTHETFHATYRRVQDAFDAMFQRLFGGGHTRLVLTDPQNLLETGIDIIVQPPGKRLQHLQLLSGGEKALTAVALLFALMEVKPSPFCLLDEVDAALDEANVSRFSQVVRDFASRSQFIIITHNKATMSCADTLFGVTMEEPGVSKMISVKLED